MKGQGVSLHGTSAWSYRSSGSSIFELNDPDADSLLDITGAFGCAIHGMSFVGNRLGDPKTHPIHGIYLYWDEYMKILVGLSSSSFPFISSSLKVIISPI